MSSTYGNRSAYSASDDHGKWMSRSGLVLLGSCVIGSNSAVSTSSTQLCGCGTARRRAVPS